MKVKIWEKDDFFEIGGQRIDMDPAVVTFAEEPLPLVWQFNFNRDPVGEVTDVCLENREITGEVRFFDPSDQEKYEKDWEKQCRFGGYYNDVTKFQHIESDSWTVTECTLRAVAMILKIQSPGFPKVI